MVVQLAMAQFSPRIVQTFLQDRPSQNAIGLFVATFVHTMLTMREVQVDDANPVVPGVSMIVAFAMALIEMVGSETRTLTESLYPDELDSVPAQDDAVIPDPKSGVLIMVGKDILVDLAREAGS